MAPRKTTRGSGSTAWPGRRAREWLPAAGPLALALVVRIAYVLEYRKNVFFDYPIIDSATYDRMARGFALGKALWPDAFWQPPLYPWLLGLFYRTFGPSLLGVRLGQAVLGSLSCVLLYALGRRVFGRGTGLLAAFGLAVYGPAVYFDGELLPVTLYIVLLLSGLLALVAPVLKPRGAPWSGWAGAGMLFGLAALARPDVLLFLVPAVVFCSVVRHHDRAWPRAEPLLMLLGAALVISVVTIRNYKVASDFVPISSNAGLNFYIGNNPDAEKTIALRPGFDWEILVNEPYMAAGITAPSARSRYFFQKGLDYLRRAPASALSLYRSKIARFLNAFEVGRNRDVYGTRQDSALLSILLWRAGPFGFPFGLLAPLAAAGMVVRFRREPQRLLLYLFLIAQSVAVVAFFVAARYRLPLVPILLLFATDYCLWLRDKVGRREWRAMGPSLAVLIVAFVVVNRGLPAIDHIYRAETDRYLGIYHVDRGDPAPAEQAYRRALAADPEYAEAHAELGQLLRDQGRYAEALRHLRRANELCPRSAATSYLVGTAYAASGDPDSAESWFRKAVTLAPYALACRDLGILLLDHGRLSEAEALLARASELDADDLDTWYKLGQCFVLQGRYVDAERALREALRLSPGDTEIREKVDSLSRIRRAQGLPIGAATR